MNRAVPFVLTAMLLLTGCIFDKPGTSSGQAQSDDDAAAPDAAGPARFTESTGAIEGIVVDDSINPIPNAQVGIIELGLVAVSDAGGQFTFNELAPGRVSVQASALGYQAAGASVEVVAGTVSQIQLILAPIPTAQPFPETLSFVGLIECGWGISNAGTGNCLPIQFLLQDLGQPNPTNTRTIGLFPISDPANAFMGVFELTWDPAAATTAAELSLLVEQEGAGAVDGKQYGSGDGVNPIRVVTDDEPYKDLKPDEGLVNIQTRTFPAARIPPTTVVNQRFTVYATTCYFAECPETFTALIDE